MRVFLICYLTTVILACLICFLYEVITPDRVAKLGWAKHWGLFILFIALAPVTVPWWIIDAIRVNRTPRKVK